MATFFPCVARCPHGGLEEGSQRYPTARWASTLSADRMRPVRRWGCYQRAGLGVKLARDGKDRSRALWAPGREPLRTECRTSGKNISPQSVRVRTSVLRTDARWRTRLARGGREDRSANAGVQLRGGLLGTLRATRRTRPPRPLQRFVSAHLPDHELAAAGVVA